MRTRILLILGLAGSMVLGAAGQEPSRVDVSKKAKKATAFVQVGQRGSGSAFCVHESGLFLTNAHVVHDSKEVTLVLHPGLADQEVLTAKVIRVDRALDLALLKIDEKAACSPLPIGSSDDLAEQNDVLAAGFPFGKYLALEKREYPSVSINSGKISSLRLKNGKLERIQIDAVVNPGNSGGPILDAKGKVIGVVVSGVPGATVNFAIPASHVHTFVSVPEIEVELPRVIYADRFKAAAFQVRAIAPLPAKQPYTVELILGPRDGSERSYAMKLDKEFYRAVAQPLQSPQGPMLLKATLSYPTGSVSGMVADRSFKVGADVIKLSSVRSLRPGKEADVVLTDEKSLKGPLSGLEELAVQLGGATIQVNAAQALEMVLAKPSPDTSMQYTVIVRSGAKELARVRDDVPFRDAPGLPAPSAKTSGDPEVDAKKLDGFWVVEQSESKGKLTYPQHPEEAIYIEGTKVQWVKKNGKVPPNCPEADIEVDAAKNPHLLNFTIRSGPAGGQKWRAIWKIDGNRLTVATNCDEDSCPTLFTVRVSPGSAQFVRTYRRVTE